MVQRDAAGVPDEVVKRLAPTQDTIRQLYLLSGNRCAMDTCNRPIFDAKGLFVAQACHIEGVKGERFNKFMTNEERRHPSNLVLLCHRCHIETNDEEKWTVEEMRAMKEAHERRFRAGFQGMLDSVRDWTQGTSVTPAASLAALSAHHGWEFGHPETDRFALDAVNGLASRIREVSLDARLLLHVIVRRSRRESSTFGVEWAPVPNVLAKRPEDVGDLFTELLVQDLARIDAEYWDTIGFNGPYIEPISVDTLNNMESPTWQEIRDFLNSDDKLRELIVDLRFDHLD